MHVFITHIPTYRHYMIWKLLQVFLMTPYISKVFSDHLLLVDPVHVKELVESFSQYLSMIKGIFNFVGQVCTQLNVLARHTFNRSYRCSLLSFALTLLFRLWNLSANWMIGFVQNLPFQIHNRSLFQTFYPEEHHQYL